MKFKLYKCNLNFVKEIGGWRQVGMIGCFQTES
jgi:hypothetical protein